jgi:5'-nucleotidase
MKPRILLTNDDGIEAEGLRRLLTVLQELGEVTVVAPEAEQSGTSHALTIRRPLRVHRRGTARFSIDGTPTDCIHLGLTRILDHRPDLVVSGINLGSNVGQDLTYSGTVAAALEAALFGIPSFALSLQATAAAPHFTAAAGFGRRLAGRLLGEGLPVGTFLNVNVPAGPIAGVRWTRQGRHNYALPGPTDGGDGQPVWIRRNTGTWEPDPQADVLAVREGWISITPLLADWTHHDVWDRVSDWEFPMPAGD